MKPDTKAIIDDLERLSLFSSTGQHSALEDVDVVPSWNAAVKSAKKIKWENFRIEAANAISAQLLRNKPDEYQRWNEIVDELNPHVERIVANAIQATAIPEDLQKGVRESATWDILHLLMEVEYSDYITIGLCFNIGAIYRMGYFPCGWNDSNPDSPRFVIY